FSSHRKRTAGRRVIFSSGFEIDAFETPAHRPIDLPYQLSRDFLIKGKGGPIATIAARIGDQPVLIGRDNSRILAARLAVNPKGVILRSAFISGPFRTILGLVLREGIKYVEALFNCPLYLLVIGALPICNRFTNVFWMDAKPVHRALEIGDEP